MNRKQERRAEESALPEDKKKPSAEKAADADASPVSLESRIKILEAETIDLKDKLLRKQADFENFRKRMLRERDEAARYANGALLSDLISVIDDFERAIRSAEESKDFAGFLTGISMVEKQLVELLETRWGLKRFASVGEGFDPNKHEAVLKVEGPADAKPTVVEDFQKGYYLHDRVLRPAKVKVMVPAVVKTEEEQESGQAEPKPDAGQAEGKGR
jgi:molecular chaperone GrpE